MEEAAKLTVDQFDALIDSLPPGVIDREGIIGPVAIAHKPRGWKFKPVPACCEHLLCLEQPTGAVLLTKNGVQPIGFVWLCDRHSGVRNDKRGERP